MKRTILAATAVIYAGTFSMAYAAGRGGPAFDFSAIDADGNGEITQAEVTAYEAARFAEADTDSNGVLSQAELVAQFDGGNEDRATRRIERMISHLDSNDDGALSLEERQASDRSTRMFDRIDRDDSGTISAEEAERVSERGGRGGKRGGHGKGGKDRS